MSENDNNVTPEFKEIPVVEKTTIRKEPVIQTTAVQTPAQQIPIQQVPVNAANNVNTPKGGKGLAIASMVLGIISVVLCCIVCLSIPCAIVGLILGIISVVKKAPGSGMAIAGIILSSVGIILFAFIIILATIDASGGYPSAWGYNDAVTDIFNEIKNY